MKGAFEIDMGNGILTIEELEFDPDPSVMCNQIFFNNTAFTQTYTATIMQPAYLASTANQVYGSVVVSLLDQDNPMDGALLKDAGIPIYQAYIDGVLVDDLMNPSYQLYAPVGTATVNSGLKEFGWDPYNGDVMTSLGINITLELSPGDAAAVLSRFDVVAVPEPATICMLGLGGLVLLRKRRA